MGSLRFALTYDIDKERKGGDTLSDLDINLYLTPTNYLSFNFDGGFDPGPWDITQGRAYVTFSDPRPVDASLFGSQISTGLTQSASVTIT